MSQFRVPGVSLLIALLSGWSVTGIAGELPTVSLSAFLVNDLAEPQDGSFDVCVRLFASPEGDSPFWEEGQDVFIETGMLQLEFGWIRPLPIEAIQAADDLWVELAIGPASMSPIESICATDGLEVLSRRPGLRKTII